MRANCLKLRDCNSDARRLSRESEWLNSLLVGETGFEPATPWSRIAPAPLSPKTQQESSPAQCAAPVTLELFPFAAVRSSLVYDVVRIVGRLACGVVLVRRAGYGRSVDGTSVAVAVAVTVSTAASADVG